MIERKYSMKKLVRAAALLLALLLFAPAAFAASATPTPPPVEIPSAVTAPPAEIQAMLDIAYAEWETLGGEKLPDVNKFTEWRGKGYKFEWCAGYVTWVMMEAGIPMQELSDIRAAAKESDDGLFHVDGLYHCKEASPGKLLRAYQLMERATMIPQKGFIVIYGCSFNKVIHAALVYDVEDLGDGKYRLTTLEGNIGDSIKMYIRDYDMNAEVNTNSKKSTNLSEVPEDERVIPASANVDYTVMSGKPSSSTDGKYMYYVNRFLMPWVPEEQPEPTATAEPTATPTAKPTPTEAPTVTPTAEPAATDAPTAEPVVVTLEVITPAPAVTEAPTEMPTEAPTATPTLVPTATPTLEPTPTPEPTAEPAKTYPCQGKDGNCPYITRSADDPFCRACDRNDNGIEDSKE